MSEKKEIPCRCNQEGNIRELQVNGRAIDKKIDDKFAAMDKKIDDIYHVLIDNGQPGLVTQHNNLDKEVTKLRTELRTKEKQTRLMLGGGGLVGAIMLILQIIIFIKG